MNKPTVAFEWQELPEHEEFPPAPPDEVPPTQSPAVGPGRKRQVLVVMGGALCLLVAALFSATWAMGRAQTERAQLHDELAMAVEAEIAQTGDEHPPVAASIGGGGVGDRTTLAGYQTTLPPYEVALRANPRFTGAASSGFLLPNQDEVRAVEVQALGQGVAAVMVVTKANSARGGPATAYRQLRFYRQTDDGWQPTEPVATLWGQPQRLATAHFDFTYRSRDAQAVEAVAAELDALYEQAHRNLGLASTPDWRIDIEVVMETVADRPVYSRRDPIIVSSPALLAAPESLTDAVILRQAILLQLVDRAVSEAVSTHAVPSHWHPLFMPMRLWQIWDLGGPLAAGREPMFRWLYVDLQEMDDPYTLPPTPAYVELCAVYSVWGIIPGHTKLAWLCSETDRTTMGSLAFAFSHPNENTGFIRIPRNSSYLTTPYNRFGAQAYGQDRFDAVLTAALLDYAAATYGREQIGALWPALREHKGWETLIPAVFGVSVDEFETGWQAYMANMFDQ